MKVVGGKWSRGCIHILTVDTNPCDLWRLVDDKFFLEDDAKRDLYIRRIRYDYPDVSDDLHRLRLWDSHKFFWDRKNNWVYDWFCGCAACLSNNSCSCLSLQRPPKKGTVGKLGCLSLSRLQVNRVCDLPAPAATKPRANTREEKMRKRCWRLGVN